MTVFKLVPFGSMLVAYFEDGSRTSILPAGVLWKVPTNPGGLKAVIFAGEQLVLHYDDGKIAVAYPGNSFYYVKAAGIVTPPEGRFIWPFDLSTVNSEFGPRPPFPYHNGIDFEHPVGTPVIAMGDGVVSKVEMNTGDLGYYIRINHGVVLGETLLTGYAHFNSPPLFGVGDTVAQGVVIGYVGVTGFTSGAHLHLETWQGVTRINPRDWMTLYAAA